MTCGRPYQRKEKEMADICHECENPAWTGRTIEAPALPSGGEGGTSNFNALDNRPKYDGVRMTGNTDIPNVSRDIERLDGDVEDIQALIPETATPENQLADKDFVNSSVATNTANFVGTYNSLEELEAVENPSNNDYGFVISTDEYGNTVFNRYKYVSSVEGWEFEYALNNSSFTAVQWAAINSGITSGNVEKINAILAITSIGNGLVLENSGQLRQKLYTETGNNTDAAMDQKSTTEAIDAVYGHARALTSADYNYPEDNPTCVALWLLPSGLYTMGDGTVTVWASLMEVGKFSSANGKRTFLVLDAINNNSYRPIFVFNDKGEQYSGELRAPMTLFHTRISNGGDAFSPEGLLSDKMIINSLSSALTDRPLSAAQGKTLADRIGTLSNLNTTAKTNAVAAINEVAGYVGKARELTEADYNWPTSNPTSVALWLLPPGLYVWGRGASNKPNIAASTSETSIGGYGHQAAIVTPTQYNQSTVGIFAFGNGSAGMVFTTNKASGAQSVRQPVMTIGDIVNNLTTNSQYKALSAAQGVVLKGLIDGKQDKLTAGNGIEIDSENVISIATISTEDWSALWQ